MSRFLRLRRTWPAMAACAAAVTVAAWSPAPAYAADPVGGPRLGALGLVTSRPAGTPPPPIVGALAYVVADADSGSVLAAKSPHLVLRPASTLKALTAVTIFNSISLRRVITATAEDANIEGSKAGVVPGGTYTVHQLWQAVFLQSGNDAIHALAVANGGVAATVAEMNAEARDLQALDTHVVTSDGLDEDGQVSSAYDLALIGRAALRIPALSGYATTLHVAFPGKPVASGRRKTFVLWSQQKFVQHYPGALGLKNGYTHLAGNTLIAVARRDGHTVIVTILGDKSRAWQDATKLADWYFAHAATARPVGQLVGRASLTPPPPAASTAGGAAEAAPAGVLAAGVSASRLGSLPRLVLATVIAALLATVTLRTRVVVRRRRRRPRPAR